MHDPHRQRNTGDAMAELDRDQVHRELTQAPADYHALLEAATPDLLRRETNGTRWTNREMLFHLLLGYLIVRNLLPLVRLIPCRHHGLLRLSPRRARLPAH